MLSLIAAAAIASTPPVTLQGVGDLRIGMSVAALRRLGARSEGEIEPGGRRPGSPGWNRGSALDSLRK